MMPDKFQKQWAKEKTPQQLWDEAVQTLGESRYHHGIDCWIIKFASDENKCLAGGAEIGRIYAMDVGRIL